MSIGTSLSSLESFSTITSAGNTYKLLPCDQSLYVPRHSHTAILTHDKNCFYPQVSMKSYSPQFYNSQLDVRSNSSLIYDVLGCAYNDTNMPLHNISQSFDSDNEKLEHRKSKNNMKEKRKDTVETRHPPLSAFFCFTRKKHNQSVQHGPTLLKNSRKSTNVVRYRNTKDEPTLRGPLNNCLLLGKYKFGVSRESIKNPKTRPINTYVSCNLVRFDNSNVICEPSPKSVKIQLDTDSVIEELVSEKTKNLMKSIVLSDANVDMSCFNEILQHICEVKSNISNLHPTLKVPLNEFIKDVLRESNDAVTASPTCTTSVDCPSKTYFTKDKQLSSIANTCVDNGVQCDSNNSSFDCGIKKIIMSMKGIYDTTCDADSIKPLQERPNSKNNSFERDQRIQKLERILRNTMYESGSLLTVTNQDDMEITKCLIHSLENMSDYSTNPAQKVDNKDMEEVPKIKETINNIIRETNISTEIAADFLNAYLNILMDNCSNNNTESSSSDSNELDTLTSKTNYGNKSQMSSKSIATITNAKSNTSQGTISDHTIIPNPNKINSRNVNVNYTTSAETSDGQHYLKDIFDKFANIFNNNPITQQVPIRNCEIIDNTAIEFTPMNIAGNKPDKDSLRIDLSKYHLENVLMRDDPADVESVSVTIKLKRKLGCDDFDQYSYHSQDTFTTKTDPDNDSKTNLYRTSVSMNTADEDVENVDYSNFTDNVASNNLFDIYESSQQSVGFTLERSFFQPTHRYDKYAMTKNLFKNEFNQSCYIVSSIRKTSKQFMCDTSTKSSKEKALLSQSSASSDSQSRDRVAVFDKTPPKTIDEKFILLLLENLSLLSKDLPLLNKDIRNMYLKLKKKHDKHMKVHKPALSLLGKIYNDEYTSNSRVMEHALQSETDVSLKNHFVQTSQIKIQKVTADKPTNTMQLLLRDKRLQTDIEPEAPSLYTATKQESGNSSSQTFTSVSKSNESHNEDKGVSTPNWNQLNLTTNASAEIFLKNFHEIYSGARYKNRPTTFKCCHNCCRGYPKYNTFTLFAIEDKWNLCIPQDNEDIVSVYRCESERSYFSGDL